MNRKNDFYGHDSFGYNPSFAPIEEEEDEEKKNSSFVPIKGTVEEKQRAKQKLDDVIKTLETTYKDDRNKINRLRQAIKEQREYIDDLKATLTILRARKMTVVWWFVMGVLQWLILATAVHKQYLLFGLCWFAFLTNFRSLYVKNTPNAISMAIVVIAMTIMIG